MPEKEETEGRRVRQTWRDEKPPRDDQRHTGPLVGEPGAPHPDRMEPGRHVPPPEHREPVRVPEREWVAHNRRRDTARGHLDEDPPTE